MQTNSTNARGQDIVEDSDIIGLSASETTDSTVIIIICITILAVLATSFCCAVYFCIRKYFCCPKQKTVGIYDESVDMNTNTSSPKTIPTLQNAVDSTQSPVNMTNQNTPPMVVANIVAAPTAAPQPPPLQVNLPAKKRKSGGSGPKTGSGSNNAPATGANINSAGSGGSGMAKMASQRSRNEQLVVPPKPKVAVGSPTSSVMTATGGSSQASLVRRPKKSPSRRNVRKEARKKNNNNHKTNNAAIAATTNVVSLTDRPAITADMIKQTRNNPKTREVLLFKARSFND